MSEILPSQYFKSLMEYRLPVGDKILALLETIEANAAEPCVEWSATDDSWEAPCEPAQAILRAALDLISRPATR